MFDEENTVENFVRDLLCGKQPAAKPGFAESAEPYIETRRHHLWLP